ncbi:hypothetical protein CRYUN_Cryun01aG0140600 [Craigia yunnanensis]
MKSPPNQGEELKKAKKNVIGTKPVVLESKKTCICSPTSHAGSFRCHLHRVRASAAQNSSCCSKLNSKSQGGHEPILSRFGRASSLKLKPIPQGSLPG